jgi:malate permease and related proteins
MLNLTTIEKILNTGASTTISLLLIIIVGYLFRGRIKTADQKSGIKLIILSLALPATIFTALLKIEFNWTLMFIPMLALGFNLLMYLLIGRLPLDSLFDVDQERYRTLKMLIPSLAPGLSCFPFILAYLGESPLAKAALADIGNKVFGLVILYVIAMNWYLKYNGLGRRNSQAKIKNVLLALLKEPINMVIIVALLMLTSGLKYSALPGFMQMSIDRLSLMMTPLILLFIGLSVKLDAQQAKAIFSFLLFRSGTTFLLSSLMLVLLPVSDAPIMLLIVIFPQSAVSFWPYAHMSVVAGLESGTRSDNERGTFDLDFAMNILACSLPFSTLLAVGVCTFSNFFLKPMNGFFCGGILLSLAMIPVLVPSREIHRSADKLMACTNRTDEGACTTANA